eukprot:COSAG06_NODE_20505_length_793_cov_0.891931_1_plen_69_part_00
MGSGDDVAVGPSLGHLWSISICALGSAPVDATDQPAAGDIAAAAQSGTETEAATGPVMRLRDGRRSPH